MPLPAPEHLDSLITTAEAANLAGVKAQTITTWRQRGYLTPDGQRRHLTPAATTLLGRRPLYRFLDVAKAERATRERARRRHVA